MREFCIAANLVYKIGWLLLSVLPPINYSVTDAGTDFADSFKTCTITAHTFIASATFTRQKFVNYCLNNTVQHILQPLLKNILHLIKICVT
jgi:hypothetical protein